MRTFDDSVIEGAAENFLAGRKCGHLSATLTFEDFLAVRELPAISAINIPPIQFVTTADKQALLEAVESGLDHPSIIPSGLALLGITFWLIGRFI